MISERIEPASLTGAELDAYLARGYYRIGRSIITADYLVSDGELMSTIWTRLDLKGYRFRRSLRKIMAQNGKRYRTVVGEVSLDAAHVALYERYRASVKGHRARTLEDVLGGDEGRALFLTREIAIYLGDELVGFSWFDLGAESVESLIGVYDPSEKKHGLGFWSLLLEIAYAQGLGLRYHYAGYVLSGPSCMDYKRRVGELEHLDPRTGRWGVVPPFVEGAAPADVLRTKLAEAEAQHARGGAAVVRVWNSTRTVPGLSERVPGASQEPLLLVCLSRDDARGTLTTWDLEGASFVLYAGRPLFLSVVPEGGGEAFDLHLFVVHERLGVAPDAEGIARIAQGWLASVDGQGTRATGE